MPSALKSPVFRCVLNGVVIRPILLPSNSVNHSAPSGPAAMPAGVHLPSPLKSPVPMTCQLGPGFAPTSASLVGVVAFISQIAAWPLVF